MADPVLFELTADNGLHFASSVLREGYRVSKSANFNAIQIMGRSSPIYTYGMSGAIEVSLTTELFDFEEEQTSDMIKSLLSLCFPMTPGSKPPPLCRLTLGGEFEDWECVVTHVDANPGNRNFWGPDGKARSAMVNFSFVGIEIQSVKSKDYLKITDYKAISFDTNGGG